MQNPNNTITIVGRLENGLKCTHNCMGDDIHEGIMLVKRISGAVDRLPVAVSGKLLAANNLDTGALIRIDGQVRSYKMIVGDTARLVIKVLARSICNAEDTPDNRTLNFIKLTGTIIGETTYRHTPYGRTVCDQLLIVNRRYGKYDRVPLISWGKVADCAARFAAGQKLQITGRLQSRDYDKVYENGEIEKRTVCEVSVFTYTAIFDCPKEMVS